MDNWYWAVVAGLTFIGLCGGLWWRIGQKSRVRKELERLQKDFHREREHLEAHFVKRAGASGRPRGLAWTDCDFADDVVYTRDRKSGELSALVAVTIHFEAVEGGGMEEVEFVRAPRDATAVFRVDRGRWTTDGRAVMNLNPTETLRHFQSDLELVGEERRAATLH
jgi:hypothetical protein